MVCSGFVMIVVLNCVKPVGIDTQESQCLNLVDDLVFCKTHTDKIVELNCKTCENTVCVLCKASDHNNHTSETVPGALERLIPDIDKKSEIVKVKIQHLKAKVKTLRDKVEDTKRLYQDTKQKVHERVEVIISQLREIEVKNVEMLALEEKEAVKSLEDTKLQVEAQLEELKQLVCASALMREYARNTSLLQQLQEGLLKHLSVACEKSSEPLCVGIANHSLQICLSEQKSKTDLHKIFGEVAKRDIDWEVSGDGHIIENPWTGFAKTGKGSLMLFGADAALSLPDQCNRITLADSILYAPLDKAIAIYDLKGDLVFEVKLPFYATIIKKVPLSQWVVGGKDGLYLFDGFTDRDVDYMEHFCSTSVSDIQVIGEKMYTLAYDKRIIDSWDIDSWTCLEEESLHLTFVSKGHSLDTFCMSDNSWLICSEEDQCVYKCNMQGELLQTVIEGKSLAICDCSENIILADRTNETLCMITGQDLSTVETLCNLSCRPLDALFDCHGDLWVLVETNVEEEEIYDILKYRPVRA